jgi:hypothetical protein
MQAYPIQRPAGCPLPAPQAPSVDKCLIFVILSARNTYRLQGSEIEPAFMQALYLMLRLLAAGRAMAAALLLGIELLALLLSRQQPARVRNA